MDETFEAKYRQNDTFFSYKLKKGISWMWKGIMKSRKILREGTCFRIGDVTTIDIWRDPWVLGLPNNSPLVKEGVDSINIRRVFELRDSSNIAWNVDLIHSIFTEESTEAILRLEWPCFQCSDKIIWTGNKEGRFSVKSCYNMLFRSTEPSNTVEG